jgi:beta-phosphoglucomutase-like phosphatase (HAD superfamily)
MAVLSPLRPHPLFIAGAVELVRACRAAGLKVAVGSSAEQVKVRLIIIDISINKD